ncbi:coiled-coil domain-containing protein 151 [Echeneis naucrates]|uniref:coiled-coil domain-containing protein 151 n=1 Tax=Echeneis naucrates TaxID=173247 RepID=UPI001113DA5C|nr:coiled-coil domain-containing protein 151 [Echeneis naucrates]
MPLSGNAVKAPLHDQIMEMQRKIQLLEGDRAAHHESSQAAMKKNREAILQLRQENKRLYRKLAQGDEHIIKAAFHNRGLEKDVYRNMSGKMALTTLDQKALSKMKRLNALKHTTQTYEQRLEELKVEYQRMKPEGCSRAQSTDACTRKKEEDAMNLRALENSLEKTQFKCKEAENIMTNYLKLKSHMQEESLTFQSQLDSLEAEILKSREELHNLQVMNNDAQHSKEAAKAELQKQEEQLYKERKERERIIASYRKKVEERKAHAEKVDRRTQRANMQQDELSSEVQHSTTRMTGEEEKAISTFEEAFQRIKEATGVTDVQDVVQRFISQKETHLHLEKLKAENEKMIQQLKEQKELLSQQFQDVKYSGEAKLSSDQQMLEESEQRLQAQQQKCDVAKERLDWLVKTISTIRAGVEHLANKLQHIRLSADTPADVSADSDEFVLELMTQCELKLQLLQEELQGKDLAAIMKEMEKEEFFVRIERKLPSYNTRVKLPEDQSLDLFNDEDESEEDEADILSREALKRQSQLIVDSKSKKKPWKKKKGKF